MDHAQALRATWMLTTHFKVVLAQVCCTADLSPTHPTKLFSLTMPSDFEHSVDSGYKGEGLCLLEGQFFIYCRM